MDLRGQGPEWEHSERPAIEQLVRMGYSYVSPSELRRERASFSEVMLIDRLRKALASINKGGKNDSGITLTGIDVEGIEEAVRQLRKFDTNIPIDANVAYCQL